MEVCTQDAAADGPVPLDAARLAAIHGRLEEWGRQGLRGWGWPAPRWPPRPATTAAMTSGLVFGGFLLFADRPRPAWPRPSAICNPWGAAQDHHPGDTVGWARHTAAAVGLADVQVLTGADLDALSDDALRPAAGAHGALCRGRPQPEGTHHPGPQAQRPHRRLHGRRINDAPSLHIADVGISVDSGRGRGQGGGRLRAVGARPRV